MASYRRLPLLFVRNDFFSIKILLLRLCNNAVRSALAESAANAILSGYGDDRLRKKIPGCHDAVRPPIGGSWGLHSAALVLQERLCYEQIADPCQNQLKR